MLDIIKTIKIAWTLNMESSLLLERKKVKTAITANSDLKSFLFLIICLQLLLSTRFIIYARHETS